MKEPRKHHYLPQFYLRGFSTDGYSIFQVDKEKMRGVICSIRDAAAIRDFHRLDFQDARDPYGFEKALSRWEGRLSESLTDVCKANQLTDENLPGLLLLASQLRFRVPGFKQFVERLNHDLVQSTMEHLQRAGKLPPPPLGLDADLFMKSIRIEIRNWKCLEEMFKLASNDKHLQVLCAMRPELCKAPSGYEFITSDQPFILYHPNAKPQDVLGVSLLDTATEVTIPLTLELTLRLTWDDGDPSEKVLNEREVNEFNRRATISAKSYVFAAAKSARTLALVSRHRRHFAGIDFRRVETIQGELFLGKIRPVMSPQQYLPNRR